MITLWQPRHELGAIAVIREVFDEYGFTWDEQGYHADLYDVPQVYLALGDLFFVAEIEDHVVGTAAVEFFSEIGSSPKGFMEMDGKTRICGTDCSLERLYVRPGFRGAGVGAKLMSRAIEEARLKGCKAMEIWSDKRFAAAHRLYERFGAKVIADRICDDPDESPEWGLRIDL